MDYAVYLIPN